MFGEGEPVAGGVLEEEFFGAGEEAALAEVVDFEFDEFLLGDGQRGDDDPEGADGLAFDDGAVDEVEAEGEVFGAVGEVRSPLLLGEEEDGDVEGVELGFEAGQGGEGDVGDGDELDGEGFLELGAVVVGAADGGGGFFEFDGGEGVAAGGDDGDGGGGRAGVGAAVA